LAAGYEVFTIALNEPTHLDLFSGIGGFALAAQWAGFRTIGFCEIDKYCQKIIVKNFLADTAGGIRRESQAGNWREMLTGRSPKIFRNIFDLDGTQYRGVSIITGGFPCQPFSVAGKRRGAADDRAIWPEMFRVIREARPAWLLGENVPGIIPMELDNVLSDLESIGYATRPFVIPACAVDARHRRDRIWIIGRNVSDSNEQGSQGWHGSGVRQCASERVTGKGYSLADTDGCNGYGRSRDVQMGRFRSDSETSQDNDSRGVEWFPEPDVGRVAHGIPSRVDRLKGLGNAIVPQVAYEILREIRKLI
jgi:DNA (cytosine-5)-methyltransferase 1